MTPENLPLEEPQPQRLSELARLTGVFFEPKKTFADIAERPSWLIPTLLMVVASLVFAVMVGQRVGWERTMRQQIESRMATMSQQQRDAAEQTMDMQVKIAKAAAYVGPPILVPLGYVIAAAVLLGIASGILSAGITFRQMLAVVSYASVPGIVKSALAVAVMYLKSPDEFNLQNPVGFNPGAYLDPNTTSKFVHSLASSLDLFTLWLIVLVAIGIQQAAGRRLGFGASLAAVLVPWGVVALAGAAVSSLF